MSRHFLLAVALATSALAAPGMAQDRPVVLPDAPCPPSGFAAPRFSISGGNDHQLHPFEIASQCLTPEVKLAIEAMGLGRSRPMSQKGVMSVRFSAKGSWSDPVAGPVAVDKVNWDVHFYYPAVRAEFSGTAQNGRPFKTTKVGLRNRSWDETTPGVGPRNAPRGSEAERAVWVKLMPQGAMLAIVEAQGTAKQSKDSAGRTVVTGKSPYDAFPVTITLNEKHQIARAVVEHGGHTYSADFIGYNDVTAQVDPVRNKWEPAYMVPWVDRMVWTRDGKAYADFTTTAFNSNAFMVFPEPELLKAEPEEPDRMLGYDKNDPTDPRNDPANQFSPEMLGTPAFGSPPTP